MRVMVVVMVASQHEALRYATSPGPVNSKESIGVIGFRNSSLWFSGSSAATALLTCNRVVPAKMSSPHI
jgi:hypothetical protein